MKLNRAHKQIGTKDLRRLVFVIFALFVLFSFLILQFYKIQIVEGDKWLKIAKAQHEIVVSEPFKRGVFYSNTTIKKGHPLQLQPFIIDVPHFHLFADPLAIPPKHKKVISHEIKKILKLSSEEKDLIVEHLEKRSHSRRLYRWLDLDHKVAIALWWENYAKANKISRNALYFVQEFKRSYPFGKLLGPVLHTVREERDLETGRHIPTGGLELYFDDYLKGKDGKRLLLRSPRHPLDTGTILSPPEDGADIYLTINHYLQAIAEEEMEKAVKKAHAKGGWAAMLDPKNGEVYAIAQYPFFDPSNYRKYYNHPEKLEATRIRAFTDCFEPGSTLKPITLAIVLMANEEGRREIFSQNEMIRCDDGHFPGRSRPMQDVGHHRYLNFHLALQKSSNIYLAKMMGRAIETYGNDWYRKKLNKVFGFGKKTGIELPGESGGFLPRPGKQYACGALEWSTPTPYSLAIGYNLMVNGMQLLRAFAILVNGGYDIKPTLIQKIVKRTPDGNLQILLDNTLNKVGKRLFSAHISNEMIKAMKYVTKPGGIGKEADVYGYTEGGKTSTTEKIVGGVYSKKDHFSSFIGFAPASDPRLVLMVGIEEPEYRFIPGIGKGHFGGRCAAPAFRNIMERSLHYLGITPDDPYGYPVGDPRYDPKKADYFSEVKELNALYRKWNY